MTKAILTPAQKQQISKLKKTMTEYREIRDLLSVVRESQPKTMTGGMVSKRTKLARRSRSW